MRNLAFPKTIHKGHISAVIDVDYAPTGKEFVTGGYDKSVRIFEADSVRRNGSLRSALYLPLFCPLG